MGESERRCASEREGWRKEDEEKEHVDDGAG